MNKDCFNRYTRTAITSLDSELLRSFERRDRKQQLMFCNATRLDSVERSRLTDLSETGLRIVNKLSII